MPSLLARSTAQRGLAILSLPELSTDVPTLEDLYEPLVAKQCPLSTYHLCGQSEWISLLVENELLVGVTGTRILFEPRWPWPHHGVIQTVLAPTSVPPSRRGKPIPSEVSLETARKAKRAAVFLVARHERAADEGDDPDYGL